MLAKYIIPMQISADQTVKFMCTLRFAYLYKAAKRGGMWVVVGVGGLGHAGGGAAGFWPGLNERLPLE